MSRKGRKGKFGAEDKAVFEWERDRILPENLRDEMEMMWEIPQIYHFLQLTKEVFNITHLSMYEVERMLLMPKASRQLAHIMTCLLSSPSVSKNKVQKVPPMPYEFWTNILTYKLKSWYKIYQTKRQDRVKVFDTLGVEPEFWGMFPGVDDIEGKDFQDFTFRQRVWLLKTVCDTAMHSRKSIQEEMARQPWENQFETVLGVDRYGARYVYFPQFLHNDLRVYKHCLDNKVLSTVKPPVEVKPKLEIVVKQEPKVPRAFGKKKRRKSRWSKGSLPSSQKLKPQRKKTELDQGILDSNSNSIDSCSRSSRSSSKASELSASSLAKSSSGYETNVSGDIVDEKIDKDSTEFPSPVQNAKVNIEETATSECKNPEDTVAADDHDAATIPLSKTEDSPTKDTFSAVDELSKSSKTDDEKLEEISSLKAAEKPTDSDGLMKELNISKSDDEKLSESRKSDSPVDVELPSDDVSQDTCTDELEKENNLEESFGNSLGNDESSNAIIDSSARRSARIKHISEIKMEVEDAENMLDVCETEELSSIDLRDDICRVSSPEEDYWNENFSEKGWRVEDFEGLLCDLSVSNFQLVADSVDSLRDLTEFILADKSVPELGVEDEEFIRPECEQKLLKRMQKLCASLENVETLLKESMKKARAKLQREWNNFENGEADEDQDAGANRWLVGPQGLGSAQAPPLPSAALPSAGPGEPGAEKVTRAPSTDSAQAQTQGGQLQRPAAEEARPGQAAEEGQGQAEEGGQASERKAEEVAEAADREDDDDDEEKQPRGPKRVLRARGISSYTEQLFFDESSEEEKLDGWADIEAVYASPDSPDGPFSPGNQTNDPLDDDSEQEDSDKDWILPSSRKRRSKRPSASRRLKSFQHKLQNIKVEQNVTQPSPTKDSKNFRSSTVPATTRMLPTQSPSKIPQVFSTVTTNVATPSNDTALPVALEPVKIESQDPNLHSVLDIKDEGPIYDNTPSVSQTMMNTANCMQPNYVVVTSGHAPITNYYVVPQSSPMTAVVQQNQFIQPTAFVPQMVAQPQVQQIPAQGYYLQPNPQQNYVMQNPTGIIAGPRQTFVASASPQVVYQQPQPVIQGTPTTYVQYVAAPAQQPPMTTQPRIINTTTINPPRQIAYRMKNPTMANRMPVPARQQNFPHPNGAVIRSSPLGPSVLRPGQRVVQRGGAKRQIAPRMPVPKPQNNVSTNTPAKLNATSLIDLCDSDDEIEMIIPQQSASTAPPKSMPTPPKSKSTLPAELMQRVNEGGISISPIKPTPPPPNPNTQLVVVVNETGSHYALALPNGSKLILTPEQVAQIRASNGGKLVL